MTLPPQPTQPAPLAPAGVAAPTSRLPLPWAVAGVATAAAGLAALVAWFVDRSLGSPGWAAPLGALVGVAAAVAPAALALQRLLQRADPSALVGGTLHSPLGAARPLFLELAGREWARARRYGTGAALLLVDVDRFARLTESRGSEATDAVLAELIRLTAPTLRGADLLTRFSDAQMAVFLAQADATGALDVAERIRERTELLDTSADGRRLRSTVSVGVAHLRPAHLHLQALIDDALEAVVAARTAGGNCVRAAPVERSRLDGLGSLSPVQPQRRARKP